MRGIHLGHKRRMEKLPMLGATLGKLRPKGLDARIQYDMSLCSNKNEKTGKKPGKKK